MQKTFSRPMKPPILSKKQLEKMRTLINPVLTVPNICDNVQRNIRFLEPLGGAVYFNSDDLNKLIPSQVQVNKKGPDLIAATSIINRNSSGENHVQTSPSVIVSASKDPVLRTAQLEQNLRFLQEQHQLMLNGLHNEIETLRQRNRDLQFQLVFAKNGVSFSTPSSPEDDLKPRLSPKQVNVTPLQIELLEKEIGELKLNLQEANTKNSYLSTIVDEQKKKLENFELEWSEEQPTNIPDREAELEQKLEDADRLIRRLRRDYEDQRREITSLRSSVQNETPHHNGRNNGGNRRGQHHRGQRDHHHRFPPLHSQSYWHQSNGRGGRNQHQSRATDRNEQTEANDGGGQSTVLPSLRGDQSSGSSYTSFPASNHSNHHGNGNRRSGGGSGNSSGGGYQGNGNQYHGERKYRGHNRGNKS